jgi:hypothetical protein
MNTVGFLYSTPAGLLAFTNVPGKRFALALELTNKHANHANHAYE